MSLREVDVLDSVSRFSQTSSMVKLARNDGSYSFFLSDEVGMVPRAGLEPAHREVRDFKSLVSTISPSGHVT